MPSTFTCRLGKYLLNILDITDTWQQNYAQYEFVGADGGILDPLGLRPRTFRFRTYFFGNTSGPAKNRLYPTYANHYQFLEDMLDPAKKHAFTHPQYGQFKVRVPSIQVTHNDTHNYVEIELELIEDGLKTEFRAISQIGVDLNGRRLMAATLNGELSKMSQTMSASQLGDYSSKFIDVLSSITSQVKNVSSKVRGVMKQIDSAISVCDNFITSIEQPLNSVVSSVQYAASIPSKMIGSVQSVSDRMVAVAKSVSQSPLQMVESCRMSLDNLKDTIEPGTWRDTFVQQIRVVGAATVGRALADAFAEDERKRRGQNVRSQTSQFDVNGRRVGSSEVTYDFLTVDDIERSLYQARLIAQEALDNDRDNQPIRDMMEALVRHVDDIKLKKQRLKTITVTDMPMHLLMHTLGQTYGMAEITAKVNSIPCPNFVNGSVKVYA